MRRRTCHWPCPRSYNRQDTRGQVALSSDYLTPLDHSTKREVECMARLVRVVVIFVELSKTDPFFIRPGPTQIDEDRDSASIPNPGKGVNEGRGDHASCAYPFWAGLSQANMFRHFREYESVQRRTVFRT
jgi:hypothetical protein